MRDGAGARPGSDRVRARAATGRASPNHSRRTKKRTKKRSMRSMRRKEGRIAAGEARANETRGKTAGQQKPRRRTPRTPRTWTHRPLGDLMEELGTRQRPPRSSPGAEATAIPTAENVIQRVRANTSGMEKDMGTTSRINGIDRPCEVTVRVIMASKRDEKLRLHTSSRPRSCNNLLTMGRCTVENRVITQ